MNKEEIKKWVVKEYSVRYPDWKEVRVTDIVLDTFGGHIAVVRSATDSEEMCFIYPEGTVRIFGSTEELVHFLEDKAKAPWLERLFTRPVISGIVFVILLVAIFCIGFSTNFRTESLAILGSVVGVAAGFFFGAGKRND
jgi:uncharacterized membrane protein